MCIRDRYYRQYGKYHGLINVSEAIEVSCNYFFYDVGRRLGIDLLVDYATRFGLGQKTGIELEESSGVMAGPEYTESMGGTWYEGSVLSVAIGQESSQFTPIQPVSYTHLRAEAAGTHLRYRLLRAEAGPDSGPV